MSGPEQITAWVRFDFSGRGRMHSPMRYSSRHFSGVDWDESTQTSAVYKLAGHDWAPDVSAEHGNYDYLMFANLDYSNADVEQDVLGWGRWIGNQLPLSGMRLDAAKHYSISFQKRFVRQMRAAYGGDFYFVAEYWRGEPGALIDYLEKMDYQVSVFDSALVSRFSAVSRAQRSDLRRVFEQSLVQHHPEHAVVGPPPGTTQGARLTCLLQTFVANHDTVSSVSSGRRCSGANSPASSPRSR